MPKLKKNKKDSLGLPIGEQTEKKQPKHYYKQRQFVTSRTIASQLQGLTTMTEDEAYNVVTAVCKLIRNAVCEDKIVNMRHLGVFKKHSKQARPGYNFQTKEATVIAARNTCKFVPSSEFCRQLENLEVLPVPQVTMNLIEGDDLDKL